MTDTMAPRKAPFLFRMEVLIVLLAFMFLGGTVIYAVYVITTHQTEHLDRERAERLKKHDAEQNVHNKLVEKDLQAILKHEGITDVEVPIVVHAGRRGS
jgi:hypothetical protein